MPLADQCVQSVTISVASQQRMTRVTDSVALQALHPAHARPVHAWLAARCQSVVNNTRMHRQALQPADLLESTDQVQRVASTVNCFCPPDNESHPAHGATTRDDNPIARRELNKKLSAKSHTRFTSGRYEADPGLYRQSASRQRTHKPRGGRLSLFPPGLRLSSQLHCSITAKWWWWCSTTPPHT